jgi:glycine/D-amino acid oxidase-like deaminating enzyme/nitrite reductase/ring-hydroxylating ferredoxin subunit
MKQQQVATKSFWIDTAPMPSFWQLTDDEQADVTVVGAGITGLTAAYLLAKAGKSVVVLDREDVVQRDTAHTSAHLTMVTDYWLSELAGRIGRDHAQAVWDAGLAAMAQIDDIVRAEGIACGYAIVPGYLHRKLSDRAGREGEAGEFRKEAALAADLGFDAAFVDDVPLVGGPGVRFDNQARIHPRKYLAGVARAIQAAGGRIYARSGADEFSDEPFHVKANGHAVRCRDIVLATHTPLVGVKGMLGATLFQTKLALYSTYVVGGRLRGGQVEDALFWDSDDPYHYLRLDPGAESGEGDYVIFGGADHKTGQAENTIERYEQLERTVQQLLPGIELTDRWSGQVIETPDGLPYIGESAPHQFTGTGFSGNGLTFGTLSAMMAADGILGRANPWRELFRLDRKKIAGAWDYIKENKDYPYYLLRDRFAGAEARSLRSVKRGEGKIVEYRGEQVAASRGSRGALTIVSAICTHMGCLVDWNEAERTWDCPCHGSRFNRDGSVIAGPAESPLPKAGD